MFNGIGYGNIIKMLEVVIYRFECYFNWKVFMGVLCLEFLVMYCIIFVKNIKKLRKMFLEYDEGLF